METVYEFPNSIVYRAQRQLDNRPVIIKYFTTELTPAQFIGIENQLEFQQQQELSVVPPSIDLIFLKNNVAIVTEDSGDMYLSVILLNIPLSLDLFLEYAANITRNLSNLHQHHLVHNDIRPHNILINEKTGAVFFTGLCEQKSNLGADSIKNPINLDGDRFVYTSPEQTGRINWTIDQRSDLYSLGAVFYEMLSGKAPFLSDNTLSMIHAHLASEPKSLLISRKDLPYTINQLVLKLLSKGAEDRYQSALGLLKDLENCRTQFRTEGWIKPFELGRKDNIERFYLPSKLYGAEKNIVTLFESFNRVCTGSVEMMIVKGKAGMGKTSLVRELAKVVQQKKGFLASGKCEEQYRDTPYYPLISAFQAIVQQLLTEDDVSRNNWKEKFLESFARNGQLVIDFIPEMEELIGPQPRVPLLDPDESRNRLNYIFRRFFQVFTLESNPLVIFIDSFHWADAASIQLIQASLSDINSRYILLIIAYQEDLVIHSHTLSITLDEVLKSGTRIQEISVNPLNIDDICLLIEEALYFKQEFRELAHHILEQTEGNPYFAKLLLQTYHEKKLIRFDSQIGQWTWDIDQINQAEISNNVVDLLADKIRSLPHMTGQLLILASCIGRRFDLNLLSGASKQDEKTAHEHLEVAIKAGLIEPVPQTARQSGTKAPEGSDTYQFSHSRVLDAAYSMLAEPDKKATHLLLGRILQNRTSEWKIHQNPYEIINQLNEGSPLILEKAERHQLARLNLIAGKKSKSAAAFETAWRYFRKGFDLLAEDAWTDDYGLSKDLLLKRTECEYFIGNTEKAEPVFKILLKNIKTVPEKVEVINIKLNLYSKNNQYEKAVDFGLESLKVLFKEQIPPNEPEINIISQIKMQDIQLDISQQDIKNLLYLPLMTDINHKAKIDLLSSIIPAAYNIRRNLWILLTLKMVELSLRHGNTESSAFGYMNYAVILCSGLQDYNNGHAMGRLALDLNNKFNSVHLISRLNFLFGSYISHWKDKARENLIYLKRAYQAGIEHGDFISAGNSIDFLMKTHIIVGSPLEEIQKEAKKHQDFVDQLNSPELEHMLSISKLILLLRHQQPDTKEYLPNPERFDSILSSLIDRKNNAQLYWFYLISAKIHYHFYDHRRALKFILESDKLLTRYSQLAIPEHYFYHSLILLENYPDFSEEEKKRNWDIIKINHEKLASLAENCAINFEDKSLLISAIMAGISGNFVKSTEQFDKAIQSARDNGFAQNEALANELTAKYYLSKGKKTIATAYLREACLAYIRWGATLKTKHLEEFFPQLLKKRHRHDDSLTIDDTKQPNHSFSPESIIKASQTISKEIVTEKVVEKLLELLLEKTNAQKSIFLNDQEGQLVIIAEGFKNRTPQIVLESTQIDQYPDIAQSVIYYVIRTRKLISLDDASKEGMFAYNEYIKNKQPKSILCVPVLSHDKLTGIVYLENMLTAGAFLPRQIDLITLLISQVAISIENSLLYSNLADITEKLSTSKTTLEKRIKILEQEIASNFI
ncbi:AAA family ATPase [bacterium]|nr:AAA family ATPase [bacterium]